LPHSFFLAFKDYSDSKLFESRLKKYEASVNVKLLKPKKVLGLFDATVTLCAIFWVLILFNICLVIFACGKEVPN